MLDSPGSDRCDQPRMNPKDFALTTVKDLSLLTGVFRKTLFNVYPYMFEPHQLEFLLGAIRQTAEVPGVCVEVGCAYGATSVFLRKHLDRLAPHKNYIAIDTFTGFLVEHVRYETEVRHKDPQISQDFVINNRKWVSESIRQADVGSIEIVQCDASKFDFDRCHGISFCLIDVDLYLPVSLILPKIYDQLADGGILVVDDCQPHPKWDGALAAYEEFVEARRILPEIVCDKLGIIRK